jgi:hypothetical protein
MTLYFNEKKFEETMRKKKRKSFVKKVLSHPLASDLDESDFVDLSFFNPLHDDGARVFFLVAGFKLKDFLMDYEDKKILYNHEAITAFENGETLIPVSGIGSELNLKNHSKILKEKGIINFTKDLLGGHYYLKTSDSMGM